MDGRNIILQRTRSTRTGITGKSFPFLLALLYPFPSISPLLLDTVPSLLFEIPQAGANDRYAEQPTARLRIPLKLGAGDVGIYFLQSPPDKPLGTVKCWVDDNFEGGKMLEGTAEIDDVMASYVSFPFFSSYSLSSLPSHPMTLPRFFSSLHSIL